MRYEPMVGQPRQACQLPEKIQLKRIRKFLGLQNAVTYIDSRGRKRCVWYSMWLSRVYHFTMIEMHRQTFFSRSVGSIYVCPRFILEKWVFKSHPQLSTESLDMLFCKVSFFQPFLYIRKEKPDTLQN